MRPFTSTELELLFSASSGFLALSQGLTGEPAQQAIADGRAAGVVVMDEEVYARFIGACTAFTVAGMPPDTNIATVFPDPREAERRSVDNLNQLAALAREIIFTLHPTLHD